MDGIGGLGFLELFLTLRRTYYTLHYTNIGLRYTYIATSF